MSSAKRSSEEVTQNDNPGSPLHKKRELDGESAEEAAEAHPPDNERVLPALAEARAEAQETVITGTDGVAVILNDHNQLRMLFDDYRATEDEDQQRAIVQEIIRVSCIHSSIEDSVLFPEIRRLALHSHQRREIEKALDEHQSEEDLLFELKTLDPEDVRFDVKMEAYMKEVEDHIRREESELLPLLSDQLSPVQLVELGGMLELAKTTAPTHPSHPSTRVAQGPLLPDAPLPAGKHQHHHAQQVYSSAF